MQGLLADANYKFDPDLDMRENAETLAVRSFLIADAMLEERKKEK